MKIKDDFGCFLLERDYVDINALMSGLDSSLENSEPIGDVLVSKGLLSGAMLKEAKLEYLGIPKVSLSQMTLDPKVAGLISEEIAHQYTLIPIELRNGRLIVAMQDPMNERAHRDVQFFTGLEVEAVYAQADAIQTAIQQHLTVEQSAAQISHSQEVRTEVKSVESSVSIKIDHLDDAPTLKLVHSVIQEAVIKGVSDIHWEPRKSDFIVRFRIDGRLKQKHSLSFNSARSIVSCLKVMGQMNVAERRIPQDGRMTFNAENRLVDIRLSSLPTVYGEKIEVRILDPEMAQRPLDELGFSREVELGVKGLLNLPDGLIMVVGPTGSGKTTTLYALLRELNVEERNITSIEDPVEYQLQGVNQVQVNLPAGLSFAVGLKHILRQDPDVIMIGEIRDEETARIATTAALTGHLVLSTLHTKTAAEALVRLIDMGVEPYLLASALSCVLSQRLVRRLCEHCKALYQVSETEKRALRLPPQINELYQATGCSYCHGTGYKGRLGIHEFMQYNQEIKELVLSRSTTRDIERQAMASGMLRVYDDGLLKVIQGLTTVEEILQATYITEV